VTDALDALLGASDLVAVLGREVVVRLMDISSAGCLLESNCRLEKGATGLLRVRFEDAEYMDDVESCGAGVGRRQRVLPAGRQFLWTTSHERSLRRIISKLQGSAVRSVTLERQM
jgi:hypothetical protein